MASQLAQESEIRAIGKKIFDSMGSESASIFDKNWWSGQVMEWAMKNEGFKIQMFRFVDVFPSFKSSDQLARHMEEYFAQPGQDVPAFLKWGAGGLVGAIAARAFSGTISSNIKGMAQKFIAGESAREALPKIVAMRKEGLGFTVDLLGEAAVSEEESLAYAGKYLDLLETLCREAPKWEPIDILDRDHEGPIPRVNVSVKISALYSQIDPIDPEGSAAKVKERLRPLFRKAVAEGAFLNLDMEQYSLKDLTLRIFRELLDEPEFQAAGNFGIVVQAYLKDSEADLRELIKYSKKRKRPITVRLVKGAYWDYETLLAGQRGWPVPVFADKGETDANYEVCSQLLMENWKTIRAAIGSHNVRSIAHAIATAQRLGVPDRAYEIQMLYGMAEPIKRAMSRMMLRVRDYTPIGEMLPGMAYLVRRLLENTSNESFLRLKFAEGQSAERLLDPPTPKRAEVKPAPKTSPRGPFVNEPPVDFAREDTRDAMKKALAQVRKSFGETYKLVINHKELKTDRTLQSLNPAKPSEVVGSVYVASAADADAAIDAAQKAFPAWRDLGAEARAEYLFALADLMRKRRYELSAVEVFEVGKNWREAEADVGEAIDFCEYYAREAIKLARPRKMGRVPGEVNLYFYEPRGVAAVIAPWNFPLAILTGMVTAPLAVGNTVVMKPAEQSPIIAAKLMEMLRAVKIPAGVVNFLPGYGEEVGAHLVKSPKVELIAFTGSREVGLKILAEAAKVHPGQRYLKRVVCELGGKNAVIVDDDADLDEAVLGVVHSAFGFQGQKCSACSRVIVLEANAEEFTRRLVAATKSLAVAAPELSGTKVGPVVDKDSYERIRATISKAKETLPLLCEAEAPKEGYFVGPTIFGEVPPEHAIAQEEIFGPVLAVMKAKSFDEALNIANGTAYALTGGIFSRSPERIKRAQAEFRVGNLYINRGCTGALVERQAFGGFRMSGLGTKAGGPDYLLQFVDPRVSTENTMRRGFAPADE
jgi:RHH-type transcriptional regulator, proline utilization regulon repressor / proline dehydrogenase / delta 1-pyrroline-5-carboxylate dehydrogenase